MAAVRSSGNPGFLKLFTERNYGIAEEVVKVARQVGRSPAQVALNWITRRPGIVSTIIGATKLPQLEDNLAALEFDLPPELQERLEEVSRPELVFPYLFFEPAMQSRLSGGTEVRREPPWYRPRE